MNGFLAVLGPVWFLATVALSQDEKVLKTYGTRVPPGPEIVDTLRQLIGTNSTVTLNRSTGLLFVQATPREHDIVAAVLRELDVPAANIRLDVAFLDVTTQSDNAAGVRIQTPIDLTRRPLPATKGPLHFQPEFRDQAGGEISNTRQTLVVRNGSEASILVGENVPFLDWIVDFGRGLGYIRRDIVYERRNVGASLVAQPRVVNGSMIVVRLTPEVSFLVGGKYERVRYARVSTEVTVANGQTVTIGGFGENREFYDRFLAGAGSRGTRRNVTITLTARIQSPAGF